MKEYLGWKVDINNETGKLKMTQPVLVQSLSEEFEDTEQGDTLLTSARPASVLTKTDD